VPALTKDGLPNIMAEGAVIMDLDAGSELFSKDADTPRPIASVGKIFAALVARDKGIPLEGETAISEEDKQYAQGGSRSRLPVGRAFKNVDLMKAVLIASDNRAVTAIGRGAGLTPKQLVEAMNEKARALGLKKTKFTDPTGLNGNVSTPREVAIALRASLEDPVLKEIMSTPETVIYSADGRLAVQYFNTNVSLRVGRFHVLGGKTGYTDEARYCLAIAAEIGGRRLGMVFLGAQGELTRFADFSRSAQWFESGGAKLPRVKTAGMGVGGSADVPPGPMTTKLAR
jgi:D-alanyl-D-alanine endopeptidase (penicillin-binding protein 7)